MTFAVLATYLREPDRCDEFDFDDINRAMVITNLAAAVFTSAFLDVPFHGSLLCFTAVTFVGTIVSLFMRCIVENESSSQPV